MKRLLLFGGIPLSFESCPVSTLRRQRLGKGRLGQGLFWAQQWDKVFNLEAFNLGGLAIGLELKNFFRRMTFFGYQYPKFTAT